MKQLLIVLIALLSCSHLVKADEPFRYEETSWRIIRENLFNGKNAHVYRYHEDIRVQVIGLEEAADSLFYTELTAELDSLLETVKVKLVAQNGNLIIDLQENRNVIFRQNFNSLNCVISNATICPRINNLKGKAEMVNVLTYQIVRHLTRVFDTRERRKDYRDNVFSSTVAWESHFDAIDKDVLSKIYAADFEEQLRAHTINKKGTIYYWNMKYSFLVSSLSFALVIILAVASFLYFLSSESKRSSHPKLWTYIKERTLVLIGVSLACAMVLTVLNSDYELVPNFYIVHFIGFGLGILLNAVLFCVFTYYSEGFGLKRIENFVGQQLFVFLSTCLILFVVTPFLFTAVLPSAHYGTLRDVFDDGVLSRFDKRLLLTLLIASSRVLYNVLNYKLKSMVNAKDVELAKMKELKHQAELNALHSRINPHFLYNSLNSIATLAHSDADKTEEMAIGLSDLFRYSINKEDKTFVTIADEVQMVERYLEIEKIRFADRLNYVINIDDKLKSVEIPKFMIQPIVENAIKHGVSKLKQKGEISVIIRAIDKDVEIAVYDNGPAFPDEPVGGYGLLNLNEKLEILYKDDASVNWVNGDSKHFLITLKNQL